MPEPTSGTIPMGTTRDDTGLPRAAGMMDVFRDPAKYDGDKGKDPTMQAAPNMPNMQQFFNDHAEGDFFVPMHEPTHEDINQAIQHPTGAPQSELTMGEFHRNTPKTALLWWRIQLRNQNNGVDPGEAFMKSFVDKLSPAQRARMGLPAK